MFFTANPFADAERFGNYLARQEAEAEYEATKLREQEEEVHTFFDAAFACSAKGWFTDPVRVFTNPASTQLAPDDLLSDLVSRDRSRHHIEIRRLYAELMTSPQAAALRKEAARLLSKEYPEAADLNAPLAPEAVRAKLPVPETEHSADAL